MRSPRHIFLFWLLCNGGVLGAQDTPKAIEFPMVAHDGIGRSTLPLSTAEVAAQVNMAYGQAMSQVSFRVEQYPKDSVLAVGATRAKQWVQRLGAHPIQGMHLDPAARANVGALDEVRAKQQIADRLATPGLSFEDKAFTYVNAVRAFSNAWYPERLPTAEAYLKALDQMGDAAAIWQADARLALVETYYLLGRSTDIIRHGRRLAGLANVIPFYDRGLLFPLGSSMPFYTYLVAALTGVPNGQAQIDTVNTQLRAAVVPSRDMLAFDSAGMAFAAWRYGAVLERTLRANKLVGTEGKPLVAQYWLNRPTTDSATILVNDGMIRVVEMGGYACEGCLQELKGLAHIHAAVPTAQVMMLTATFGSWGNRLVPPDEEIAHIRPHFLDYLKVTVPVGIWKTQRVPSEDGGLSAENYGPNLENYPLLSKPTTWILDGHGRIRRVFLGYNDEIGQQILQLVQFLTQEAAATTSVPSR